MLFVLMCALVGACAKAEQPPSQTLPAVVLPDISSLADSVQRQIHGRHDSLTRSLGNPNASAADRAAAYGDLGAILKAAKFSDEAAACYLHAQALAPDDMRWPYYLGHAYLMRGDRARAAAAFERASTLRPTETAPLIWLGETYLDDGRLDAAQAAFLHALSLQPESAPASFGAGRTALARQAYPEAVQYLERTLAIDGRASAAHYPLAIAYRATGDAAKAEAHMRQRGERWPDLADPLMQQDDDVLDSPVAYEHRGVEALQRQDWPAAAAAFRKGLELQPADATLRHWLGAALYAAGDVSGAEKEFRDVVRRRPDFAKAHFSLGAILDARGEHGAAIEAYSAAVKSDPTMIEARIRLADAQRSAGQLQASFLQYQAAVISNPAIADAWIGGARALLDLRRHSDARQWLNQARRLHPDRRELIELERQLP